MRIAIKNSESFSSTFEYITSERLHHPVTGITTDSRELVDGDLYVALKGENFDGHSFLSEVSQKGASAALVYKRDHGLNLQQILVEDAINIIGKIAQNWREKFKIPVIAITGSNGKTSTKELLSHVLSQKYNVHVTKGNYNTSIGLSLTLLELNDSHDVSIIEMGASLPGEIEALCKIATPTHGLITNIAPAHLEGFGSIKNIVFEKAALFRSIKNGICFVNNTDKHIVNMPITSEKITFGLTPDCDFSADIYHENDGTLTIVLNTDVIPTKSHNFSFLKNSIAVITIAKVFDIELTTIINQIQSFKTPPGRCQVKQIDDVTVIDDTYNANLTSSLAALDYLNAFSGNGKKIFVFGDMRELGSSSNEQHKRIGEKCSELDLNIVYTIGNETKHTDAALKKGINHKHFKSKKRLIKSIKNILSPGDKILFKGSRGMNMEHIISGVFEL